jgi:NADPH:quinone reductase-like Zn-dependent oxidoreductase
MGGPPTREGETVLIMGTGGVSIFALQFARAIGAKVIATSSSDEKRARLEQMGAAATVNYETSAEWDAEVRELTDGKGVDLVVEVGGAGTIAKSLASLRVGGRLALIGVLTGPHDINPLLILQRLATVRGISVGSRALFEEMNEAVARHALKPVIDRVFAFGEAADAYRHLASGAHFGKVCIRL